MRLDVHAFALARSSGEPSEDAWAVDVGGGLVALADGASSAWRAGAWAAALVDAWVARPPRRPRGGGDADGLLRWIETVRESFTLPDDGAERAWFAEAAAARGAHAALLGLRVSGLGGRRPRLRTVAVGDVCLLLVRGGALTLALPVDDPDAFDARPTLVSSLPGGAPERDAVVVDERPVQVGDVLLAASDALAAFLLRVGREQPELWEVVAGVDRDGFVALVAEGLRSGLLERDDVTLVRAVLVDGDGPA